MKNPFFLVRKHPRRFWVWFVGIGSILDGLTSVLTLGYVISQFSWIFMSWDIRNACKDKDNERHS